MRRLWIFILAGVLLALSIIPVAAQDEWCYFWDFSISDGGWSRNTDPGTANGMYGTWIDDTGWSTDDAFATSYYRRGFDIVKSTGSLDLTYLGMTFDYAGTDFVPPGSPAIVAVGAGSLLIIINDTDTVDGSELVEDWTGTATGTGLRVGINSSVTNAGASYGGSALLKRVEVHGTGTHGLTGGEDCSEEETGLTRPLHAIDRVFAFQSILDESPLPTFDILAHGAALFGAKESALVNAVIDGTITEIESLDAEECYELFTPDTTGSIVDGNSAAESCRVTFIGSAQPGNSGEYLVLFQFADNPPPISLIHIQGVDGREYLQIATDVAAYAYEGQTVSAGCYLGRAIPVPDPAKGAEKLGTIIGLFDELDLLGSVFEFFADTTRDFASFTGVWVLDGEDYVNAWDEYTLEPSDSAPCNSPAGYEGCMGDARLEDASQWQSSNGVSWIQPGALMAPGSFISAVYNLNPERDPSVFVGANSAPLGILDIQLGDAKDTKNQVLGPTTLELAAGAADEGDFYTFQVENTGETPVRIDYICVLHTLDRDGNPEQPPGKSTKICYFTDATFDHGLDEWDESGDVEEDDGALLLGDGDTIEQNLKLKAGTYTLSVVTEVWGTAAYEPDDDNTTGGIEIEYAYPTTSFTSMGSKTWSKYTHRTQTFTSELVLADGEEEAFTFRAQISSPPTGVLGVRINSVCLTGDGETGQGDGDGLIQPTCGAIATPTLAATQPGTWFTWLWAQQNKFFRCELIKIINQIYTTIVNFFRTMSWAIRWSQAATIRFGNFANSLLYWLNGHLYNIAVGRIYVVEGGQQVDSAGDLGDVLLGGLKSVIDVFVDLLQRVIDFVFYLLNLVFTLALDIVVALIRIGVLAIGMIISFMGTFFDALNAFYFAWNNSTAAPIAGLPQCAVEPKENPLCIFLWVLENTIFSGRGFLFIPFLVAYGSAELLLWAIGRLIRQGQDAAQGG